MYNILSMRRIDIFLFIYLGHIFANILWPHLLFFFIIYYNLLSIHYHFIIIHYNLLSFHFSWRLNKFNKINRSKTLATIHFIQTLACYTGKHLHHRYWSWKGNGGRHLDLPSAVVMQARLGRHGHVWWSLFPKKGT